MCNFPFPVIEKSMNGSFVAPPLRVRGGIPGDGWDGGLERLFSGGKETVV